MKITKFYLDKARYKAADDSGNEIILEIDYWNNAFKLSRNNRTLEIYAQKLLKEKHKVNFVYKMVE